MQKQFTELAAQIVRQATVDYRIYQVKDRQLKVLTDLGNELEALRIAWQKATGQVVTQESFNEAMHIQPVS